MNKYLFLDIDGVLNSQRTVAAYGRLTYCGMVKKAMVMGDPPEPMWDWVAVRMLAHAQKALGFKIVLSSTWRLSMTLQDMHTLFALFDWDTSEILIGKTGNERGCRGDQIKGWLNAHAKFPYSYCIIDDDSDMLTEQQPFFVKTTFQNGLTFDSFTKIFEVFGTTYREVGGLSFDQTRHPE